MIRSRVDGSVRVLTLDRPAKRNALTPVGLDEIAAALESATEPVVYFQGAGEAFCAGADLDTVDNLDRAGAVAFAERGQAVARQLAAYDGAVVAGIDGPARGGGVELSLACDLRVATPRATIGEPGVELGLFGAWGGTIRLPQIVGLGNAADLMLTGRPIDAETAREMGLVSQVRSDPRAVADRIATADDAAVRTVAALLGEPGDREARERAAAQAFGACVTNTESLVDD
jgi:Enoyl-CoA hydratase/carnithine racemase